MPTAQITDPFASSVSVSERLAAMRDWDLPKCQHALANPDSIYSLQPSVAKALDARIRRLSKTASGSKHITAGCLRALIGQRLRIYTRNRIYIGVAHRVDDTGNAYSSTLALTEPACGFYSRDTNGYTPRKSVCLHLNQPTQVWIVAPDTSERRVF